MRCEFLGEKDDATRLEFRVPEACIAYNLIQPSTYILRLPQLVTMLHSFINTFLHKIHRILFIAYVTVSQTIKYRIMQL